MLLILTLGPPKIHMDCFINASDIEVIKAFGKGTARLNFDNWSCIVSIYSLSSLVLGRGPTMSRAIFSKTVPDVFVIAKGYLVLSLTNFSN